MHAHVGSAFNIGFMIKPLCTVVAVVIIQYQIRFLICKLNCLYFINP